MGLTTLLDQRFLHHLLHCSFYILCKTVREARRTKKITFCQKFLPRNPFLELRKLQLQGKTPSISLNANKVLMPTELLHWLLIFLPRYKRQRYNPRDVHIWTIDMHVELELLAYSFDVLETFLVIWACTTDPDLDFVFVKG